MTARSTSAGTCALPGVLQARTRATSAGAPPTRGQAFVAMLRVTLNSKTFRHFLGW